MVSPIVRYREYSPAPPLRRWVECYWSCTGSVESPEIKSVLPDGCMDIVWDDSLPSPSVPLVVGTQRRSFPTSLHGSVSVFGVRFRPGGLPGFLPAYARDLLDGSADLDAVAGRGRAAYFDPVSDAPLGSRPRIVDDLLVGRLPDLSADRFVDRALEACVERRGTPGTRWLADRLGMSRRTLERRFLAAVGVGPGSFSRILRFRRAADRMSARPDLDLGQIALDAGYADQSHFNRDVKALTGHTPGRLRRLHWGA